MADDTKPVIESVVNIFKKYTPSWEERAVIMSDKDLNERDVFSNYFPSAKLLICLYYTLRSLRREVTWKKWVLPQQTLLESLLSSFTGNCVFKYWRWIQFKCESSEKHKNKICNRLLPKKLVASEGAISEMF